MTVKKQPTIKLLFTPGRRAGVYSMLTVGVVLVIVANVPKAELELTWKTVVSNLEQYIPARHVTPQFAERPVDIPEKPGRKTRRKTTALQPYVPPTGCASNGGVVIANIDCKEIHDSYAAVR